MALPTIGLQLYSLREAIQSDLSGVLNKVAETGYVGVEPWAGLDYTQAEPLIKELGLKVRSMHSQVPVGDDKAKVLEAAEAYGLQHIIIPALMTDHFDTEDNMKKVCDVINEANANVRSAGYTLGYHNHWWEIEAIEGGKRPYEIMLENLDEDITFELDTYWVKVGGLDPVKLIQDMGARSPLLHIKDGPGVKGEPHLALGEGVIDVPAVTKAGGDNTVALIVELDDCATDMMEAVVKSFNYLKNEGLGSGRDS